MIEWIVPARGSAAAKQLVVVLLGLLSTLAWSAPQLAAQALTEEAVNKKAVSALLSFATFAKSKKHGPMRKKAYDIVVNDYDSDNKRARSGLGYKLVKGEWKEPPPSYQENVEQAIEFLPTPTMVADEVTPTYAPENWNPDDVEEGDDDLDPMERSDDASLTDRHIVSYVPIDPCQGVIAALRIAMGERIPRAFIDLETKPLKRGNAEIDAAPTIQRIVVLGMLL